MKRLAFIVCAAAIVALSTFGCKSMPTDDTVRTFAHAGGVATGLALNYCDIDAKAGEVITNIVSNIGSCLPKEEETVQDALIRTAQAHTEILIARGELTAKQGAMVVAGVRIVSHGYDLVILWKPEIAIYTDLTVSALDGFSDGFIASYRPGSPISTCVLTTDKTTAQFFNEITSDSDYKMLQHRK